MGEVEKLFCDVNDKSENGIIVHVWDDQNNN